MDFKCWGFHGEDGVETKAARKGKSDFNSKYKPGFWGLSNTKSFVVQNIWETRWYCRVSCRISSTGCTGRRRKREFAKKKGMYGTCFQWVLYNSILGNCIVCVGLVLPWNGYYSCSDIVLRGWNGEVG